MHEPENEELIRCRLGGEELQRFEPEIRAYLMERATILRYSETRDTYALGCFFIIPFSFVRRRDKQAIAASLQALQKDRLESAIECNPFYNDLPFTPRTRFFNHYYELSASVRKTLNRHTLLQAPPGLEDPTFYRDDCFLGTVITHEGLLFLELPKQEVRELLIRGIPVELEREE